MGCIFFSKIGNFLIYNFFQKEILFQKVNTMDSRADERFYPALYLFLNLCGILIINCYVNLRSVFRF